MATLRSLASGSGRPARLIRHAAGSHTRPHPANRQTQKPGRPRQAGLGCQVMRSRARRPGGPGMTPDLHISLMLAVQDAPAAVDWYKRALGATELWNLGGVAGLSIAGAPVFVGEPENNGWDAPAVA